MFGLEKQKKKQPDEFVFDLEKELKNPHKNREIREKMEARVQKIKEALRTGDKQEDFDLYGVLLHGYNSILKVIARFKK